ncbi:MAG: CDP-alcohol phosphatidyltransferase family protein [Faecousia sp.]
MKNENPLKKHRLSIADCVTLLRMAGTLALLVLRPLSLAFLWVYALTGLTDVLDGWIARKTKTASPFGAKLDSIADLLFYAVMLLRIFPVLWQRLPVGIWWAVAGILAVRILAYLLAAVKYRLFASMHTWLNKLTGLAVFLIPFLLSTGFAALYCWGVCAVAAASAFEELAIHLIRPNYSANTKSIFQERNENT